MPIADFGPVNQFLGQLPAGQNSYGWQNMLPPQQAAPVQPYGPPTWDQARQTFIQPQQPSAVSRNIQGLAAGFNMPTQQAGYTPSMNYTGAGRPVGSTVAQPKSPQVGTGLQQGYATNQATNTQGRQSLADWTREYLKQRPQAQQYAGEETGAISQVYGQGQDSLQGQLARIRQNRAAAMRDATEQSYRRAGRMNSVRQIASPGAGSGFLDRRYQQDLANVGTQAALQNSDLARQDAMYLNQQRLGQVGTRQQLMDNLLSREMQPYQMQSGMETDQVNRLGQLASLDYSQNAYVPAEDAYSRRMDFLQNLAYQGY